MALNGDYQVIYRSVSDYERIFDRCGLGIRHVERNEPYALIEMGSELVEKWQHIMPVRFQALRAVGHLTYFGLRLGYPMPHPIIGGAKSATMLGLVNIVLVTAWLVPILTPVIAATFVAAYIYSFIAGSIIRAEMRRIRSSHAQTQRSFLSAAPDNRSE